MCAAHLVQERERQRRINGYSARNLNAVSYVLGGLNQPGLDEALQQNLSR